MAIDICIFYNYDEILNDAYFTITFAIIFLLLSFRTFATNEINLYNYLGDGDELLAFGVYSCDDDKALNAIGIDLIDAHEGALEYFLGCILFITVIIGIIVNYNTYNDEISTAHDDGDTNNVLIFFVIQSLIKLMNTGMCIFIN